MLSRRDVSRAVTLIDQLSELDKMLKQIVPMPELPVEIDAGFASVVVSASIITPSVRAAISDIEKQLNEMGIDPRGQD